MGQGAQERLYVPGNAAGHVQEGEDADFRCDSGEFEDGAEVEVEREVVGVEEEEVGAEGEVEGVVTEGEVGEGGGEVAGVGGGRLVVGEELIHGGHADLAE